MKLYTIETGLFKLDGGAMFGVVPKTMWSKLNPPDENNLCTWAMRCLLIEEGNRLILIDTGIGDKQDAKFFGHYDLHGDDTLDKSLAKHGFGKDDITDVVLTHLHFDHCGGAINWNSSKDGFVPAFKNATYWSNKEHWDWAVNPNPREKASFLKENILPIQESGQLKFLNDGDILIPGVSVFCTSGHTESMMHPLIDYKGHKIAYMADLMPSPYHMPLPFVMSYDIRPLQAMEDKKSFLETAINNKYTLFFEHDKSIECCSIMQTEKGVRPDQMFALKDLE